MTHVDCAYPDDCHYFDLKNSTWQTGAISTTGDWSYLGNGPTIFTKFTMTLHNDPLNPAGLNEMLSAWQT